MHDSNIPSAKPPPVIKTLVEKLTKATGARVRVAPLSGGHFHVSLPGFMATIVKADGTAAHLQVEQ